MRQYQQNSSCRSAFRRGRHMLAGLLTAMTALLSPLTSTAQTGAAEYRTPFHPDVMTGVAFNIDGHNQMASASLRLMAHLGRPDDIFNLSAGLGYRGFFDCHPPREFIANPSFSDYLLYSDEDGDDSHIRPMGGQLLVPVELCLNAFRLGTDARLMLGVGAEYGVRLYQSHRYGRYYGEHVMNAASLAFYPQVGVRFGDSDGGTVALSLYWRRYTHNSFNPVLDIDKLRNKNYWGVQVAVVF